MLRVARILVVSILLLATSKQITYATDTKNVFTANITCADLDGSYVLSQETPSTYLGFFGSQFASDSIMNRFGTYGSQFSSLSVRNEFGQYGSSFGQYSANNNLASSPPGIFKNGTLLAFLTTNTLITGGTSLATIDASCTFFASSPASDVPPPVAPTSVSASDGLYTDAIAVTWNPVSGAVNYVVFSAESITDTPEPVAATPSTVLPVFDKVPGKVYWFWVAASNSSGLSNLSDPDSGHIAEASSVYTLSVQMSGSGSGTISSSPSSIDCGTICTAQFAAGSTVTLTETSEVGSTFLGWSGACTGTADCIITMDGDRVAMAEYGKVNDLPDEETSRIYLPMIIR